MAVDSGFIINDGQPTAIGTSYDVAKVILLHQDADRDANSRTMPQACYLSHIDLVLDQTSATAATVSAAITWDSIGDDIAFGEAAEVPLWTGLTDTSRRECSIAIRSYVRAPTAQTTKGKMYLWLKVDAGAVTVLDARLYWVVRH